MKGNRLTIWLAQREGALWVCLVAQILVYWVLAFAIRTGNELVAYQRY
jgi:hypothetical protein